MDSLILPNVHNSIDTAYLVEDYPWGFKMRTQRRYWIETHPKRGDRFVFQTKDPRSGRWCKPKKSTYYAVMALYLDEKSHVRSTAIHQSASIENYDAFIARHRGFKFSPHQLHQLKRIVAMNKTMEHFTFECKASPHTPINLSKVMQGDPEETAKAEAEEKRQEEQKAEEKKAYNTMGKVFNYYMNK